MINSPYSSGFSALLAALAVSFSATTTAYESAESSDEAEFFAVATECFFERPDIMANKNIELYI